MNIETHVEDNLLSGQRGHFAQALGVAWKYADSLNRGRIEEGWPKLFTPPQERRFCVDGTTDHGGETYAGDGQFPPFAIFDIERQENLKGRYSTRVEAEAAMRALVGL